MGKIVAEERELEERQRKGRERIIFDLSVEGGLTLLLPCFLLLFHFLT
jgi:hypothetical protein